MAEVLEDETVEGNDPYVRNLLLPDGTDWVYVSVEVESVGDSELSNFYLMAAYISEEED